MSKITFFGLEIYRTIIILCAQVYHSVYILKSNKKHRRVKMSAIYVNAAWSGKNDGDSVTVGGKTYTIGTDAFASVANVMSAVADLNGKTITFVDDSSVTPAAPFTTTYVTIDTRYATAGNIDGKTVTFTGNSNVSEVLWFDLNYKLPEADAPETVLKFENAYVYMTKIRPDYNSSVIISGSTLDYSQGGQNGNIYAANTGVVTIQNNSKVLSLGQLSAYGEVNVDQSELHACSANGVKGSLNVTNGSTFTLSGIAVGEGGSVTIDNSTMVRKAVLTAFDDGNQSVLDWTANRELPRYRVNIGAYQGSKLTGTGTMTVKNGATFDFSSAFAAAEYKDVDGANTSAAFVTVSAGSKLVIDGRDDAGKNNKVTFNVDQLINLGNVDVSGAVLLKIGSLDGRITVNNTTFTDGTVIGDAAAPAGCIDLIGDEINFEGTVTLNSAVNAFTTDSEGKHYSTNINIAKDAVVTWNTKQYNDGTWSGGFNCGSSDVLNVEGSLTITGDNVYLKAEALVAGTGKLHINDAGFQNTYGKLTVKGEMVITDRTGAYQNIKLAGNDNAATTGELDVDGGKLTIDGPSFAFGGGYNSTGWIDVTESSVLIQNGGTITANSTIFRNGKNNTLKLDNGTFQFTASPDFGTVHDTLGYGIFNNGAIEAVNGSTLDFSTTRSMGNSATIRIEDSVFSANEMINSGTLAIYGTSDVTINTYVGPVAEGSPDAIMTINGIEAQVAIGEIFYAGITCEVTSDQLSAVRAGESRTLLTVTGSGNAPAMSFTVDGAALTANADGTFSSGNYVFKFEALGDDGIANDLVLTNTAPQIKVTVGDTELGGYTTLGAAVAAINSDSGTGPYTINFYGDTTEAGTQFYIEKDVILSGVATIDNLKMWLGNSTKTAISHMTIAEGSEFVFNTTTTLNGRYYSDASDASSLTVENATLMIVSDVSFNGPIVISGNGTGTEDSTGNIYGFSKDGTYVKNFKNSKLTVLDLAGTNGEVGLDIKDYAWVVIQHKDDLTNGGTITLKDDKATTLSVDNSRLDLYGFINFNCDGGVLAISGDSVVTISGLGYTTSAMDTASKSGKVMISGLDSEITFGQVSSAVAEISITLTSAEIFSAGMVEAGDDVELFTLKNTDAALDAATVLSITIDGAAYTLGDEIVDDAGNKYVINMGDANGDSAANDLLVTMTEKAPEPVIPEDPVVPEGPGSEGGGASTEPSQKVYINPYYSKDTLAYFSDVVGEELVLGKNAFTSIAAAKKALGANADIEYCTSDWNNSFSNSKQLEGIAKISNNGYSMGYTYANYVQQYNMANGALNLKNVTADTDFENFAYVNISGSKLSGAIENNAFGFFGTGNAEKASGTAWFAQGGMVNISGSTVGEVTGYAYATLNRSDVDVLSNNDVLYANVTLENGEITSCKPIYAMANGMAQINNSDVGLLENYSYVNMSGSNIADVQNVNMIGNWSGSSSIGNFVGASMYSSISNGYGCSLTLGDVTMNGSFDSIVNYGGTLVLTGNLKGVEMLYGYGDLVASDEQIKQLGGAEKVKQTYFGDIVDLGSTADGFSGKAAELADNSEAKAVIWDAATEGGLRGWLGIGSDVDVKDSVDYVKFTAASDGTLDITSSAWSSTGDKVSINGTDLAITDGAVSFGVTAGTEYLVKIERKDNNSMSYDMTLA